ncbi:hypothetical protein D3879_25265 [Pseudomonas cavernicola]|uniref:DUF5801 domain-containing protein n=1 Tax=Pseudomonas cavernicola TaxID=2320866 RepID=A0A418X9E1_9PSED|nr:DUF5801 repeats-in-toxin domain-containing protein [Pseudomonas cavernicola]RJG09115.1 hypothetical protein D3879_25265 [Pseudomonas cavernicola]
MAITIGTVTLDETTGIQSPGSLGDDGDADNDDFGVGALSGIAVPAPLDSILTDALNEGGSAQVLDPATTTIALSGSTFADPDGTEILDFTGLGATPIIDVKFSQDTDGDPFDGSITAKYVGADLLEHDLLTADGYKIYLYPSGISNDAVIGRKATAGGATDPDGDIVFLAYLDTNTITGVAATEELDAGATGAKIWLVEFEPLSHPDATNPDDAVTISNLFVTVDQFSQFSLTGAPSGQNLFLMFGDGTPGVDDNGDPANEVSIIVTATNAVNQSGPNQDPLFTSDDLNITTGGTVNTGQGGGGTTLGHTNQMVDPGEALAFTFVTNAGTANNDVIVPNLDQNEADVESNIKFTGLHTTTGATFTIVQLQQDKAATLTISASEADFAPAGAYIDELKLFDDGFVNINYVKVSLQKKVGNQVVPVLDQNGDPVFHEFGPADSGIPDPVTGVTVTFDANGTVTLEGVEALDVIEYRTGDASGALNHSRVVIANSAVNPGNQSHIDAAFDIGQFALRSSVSVTEPFAALVFEDDGPTADIVDGGGAVTIDETALNQNDDSADGADTTAVAALFSGVTGTGTDLSPTEYAISTTPLADASGSVYGNDGPGTTELSLQIGGIDGVDDGDGTNSGLTTTAGAAIFLYYEGDLIVGRYDADNDGNTGTDGNEEAAFAIALKQDGNVAVAQYVSLTHGTPGNGTTPPGSYDEAVDLTGKVNAVVTVIDLDGDPSTDYVPIGNDINFEDDGPSADVADGGGAVTIDETAGNQDDDSDAAAVLALFDTEVTNKGTDLSPAEFAISTTPLATTALSSFGQDEEGATKVLSLAIVGGDNTDSLLTTTDGKIIRLFKEGDLIVGRYDVANGAVTGADPAAFAIALLQDGNVAVAQYVSLTHGTPGDGTTPVGSYDEAVDLAGLVNAVVTVTDGDGDTSTDSFGIGDDINFDDDGPSADVADGGGSVTIDETAGNQDNDSDAAAVLALFDTEVTNKGTDMSPAEFAISTTPLATTALSSFGQDEEGATKVLSLAIVGGDNTDSLLTTTDGKIIRLFKEGDLIVGRYDVANGAVTVADSAAFAIALLQDGNVAVAQYVSLTHGTPGDGTTPVGSYDEAVDLAGLVNAVVTVTDGDGDTSTDSFGIGDDINFDDDGPSADVADGGGSVTIDETAGNQDNDSDAAAVLALFDTEVTNKGTDLSPAEFAISTTPLATTALSSFGQDEEGATKVLSLAIVGGDNTDSLLTTTDGKIIRLFKEGDLIVGRYDVANGAVTVADSAAFAIALLQDGNVAVAQYVSLTHGTPGDGTTPVGSYDEAVDLAGLVNAVVTVTDGDGDTSTDSFGIGDDINFDDDGPTVSANNTVLLDDDALTGGNPGGSGDDANSADVSGTLGHAFGQDGAGTVAYLTSGAPTGFTYVPDGTSLLVKQGTTTVLTLTMVAATGFYTVVQDNPILHAAGLTENNQAFTITYRVTDGDGDTADGTLSINVDDDTPVVTAKSSLVYANTSNEPPVTDVGGTGVFAYSIGADKHTGIYSALNSDFLSVALTGVTVGANAITNKVVSWDSETDSQAVFNLAFTYVSNNPTQGATTNATGTLTFDKVADTYTLKLDQEIESFSILKTSTAKGFQGYELNSTVEDNSGLPDLSVANLAEDFQVQRSLIPGAAQHPRQFTARQRAHRLRHERCAPAGEHASSVPLPLSVPANTLQPGESKDLDFFTVNPKGTPPAPAMLREAIYLKFLRHRLGAGQRRILVIG